MLVDRVEPGEHLAELLVPDRDHQRQADRAVVGVAPADPVPEAEHVVRVDTELGDFLGVGRHRDEMLRDRGVVVQRREQPVARGVRVRQRLEGRERLR